MLTIYSEGTPDTTEVFTEDGRGLDGITNILIDPIASDRHGLTATFTAYVKFSGRPEPKSESESDLKPEPFFDALLRLLKGIGVQPTLIPYRSVENLPDQHYDRAILKFDLPLFEAEQLQIDLAPEPKPARTHCSYKIKLEYAGTHFHFDCGRKHTPKYPPHTFFKFCPFCGLPIKKEV